MLCPWNWGYGSGPTTALVDKLKAAQAARSLSPYAYAYTIVTDHGNYEIDRGQDLSHNTILDVDREFLTIRLSTVPTGAQTEDVYVRLCSIRAIKEHFDKE